MKALCIGVNDYDFAGPLDCPVNDSNDISRALSDLGFDSENISNPTRSQALDSIAKFVDEASETKVRVFYFSGHGFQIDGANYLAMKDTVTSIELMAKGSSIALNDILDAFSVNQKTTNIVILDACRNYPWRGTVSKSFMGKGLATTTAPPGSIICFAAAPGKHAFQLQTSRNSYYTEAILGHIFDLDCQIENFLKSVRIAVHRLTDGEQTTWEHTSLTNSFYFNPTFPSFIREFGYDLIEAVNYSEKSGGLVSSLANIFTRPYTPDIDKKVTHSFELVESDSERRRKIRLEEAFYLGRSSWNTAWSYNRTRHSIYEFLGAITRESTLQIKNAFLDGMLFAVFFHKTNQPFVTPRITPDYSKLLSVIRSSKNNRSFQLINMCLDKWGVRYLTPIGQPGEKRFRVEVVGKEISAIYYEGKNIMQRFENFQQRLEMITPPENQPNFKFETHYLGGHTGGDFTYISELHSLKKHLAVLCAVPFDEVQYDIDDEYETSVRVPCWRVNSEKF